MEVLKPLARMQVFRSSKWWTGKNSLPPGFDPPGSGAVACGLRSSSTSEVWNKASWDKMHARGHKLEYADKQLHDVV